MYPITAYVCLLLFFSFVNKYHLQASLPYIVEQQIFYNTTIITLFTMFTIIYMKRNTIPSQTSRNCTYDALKMNMGEELLLRKK